jgi:RNA polymerase sigma-70 factor (ECF subfamily)
MHDHDADLVRRAGDGDRSGFEELVRRTSRLVFSRIYLDTGDPHRAEDLLQETYLLAYRSLHRLRNPDGFRPWLLAIAHNVVTDAARHDLRQKRAAPPRTDVELRMLAAVEKPPGEAMEGDERREQVLAVLRSLPDEYRLPLTMRYITGSDYETIGTQLGLTNGSLRGLLHRGLKLLRERMPKDLME